MFSVIRFFKTFIKDVIGFDVDPRELRKPSTIILILANLLPIFGVLFLSWEILSVMLVFWVQCVIIVVFSLIKMLIYSPGQAASWLKKIYMVPYFCLHYGALLLLSGLAVFFLFRGGYLQDVEFPNVNVVIQTTKHYQLVWAIIPLFISHGVSFIHDYIVKGKYKFETLNSLMEEPYQRMGIMVVTVLLAGVVIHYIGSITVALVILIVVKTIIDVSAHLREHYQHLKRIPISEVKQALKVD